MALHNPIDSPAEELDNSERKLIMKIRETLIKLIASYMFFCTILFGQELTSPQHLNSYFRSDGARIEPMQGVKGVDTINVIEELSSGKE